MAVISTKSEQSAASTNVKRDRFLYSASAPPEMTYCRKTKMLRSYLYHEYPTDITLAFTPRFGSLSPALDIWQNR